ncbi:hypothetical protein DPMN_077480 [Dreissena polymorpha]|uniref:Uncharacterized protein n=1 Tax=Dreissena polymorpha TaxID=45954 RepID=A0A9D3YQ24_DREPO|nr:hypothetical protein DPMN_077480 [Dreissena polymorpha]
MLHDTAVDWRMDVAAYSSVSNRQSGDRFLHPFGGQRKPCTSVIASSGTEDQLRLEGGSRGIAPLTRRAFACHYLHETVREIASGVSSLPIEVKSTILRTLPEHQDDPLLSIIKDIPVRP